MKSRTFIPLFKETFAEWSKHKSARLAAAIAYYTVFSLAPLLVIVIAVAGLAFGHEAARGQILGQIQGLVGHQSGQQIQSMIAAADKPKSGIIAGILGLVALVFGASGLIIQLQDALNTIWDVEENKSGGVMAMLRKRVLSFSMILGLAFLLMVSLVVSAGLSAINTYTAKLIPALAYLLQAANLIFDLAILTLLFAVIYKYLPEAKITWRDVWVGSGITAVLFVAGQFLISLYLGKMNASSPYGDAGSLIILLLWVYYSAQLLLFGAEFTKVYAVRYGDPIESAAARGTGTIAAS